MAIRKNKLVKFLDTISHTVSVDAKISIAHSNIVDTFTKINMLYGEASISEDMVLNNFLTIFNAAKAITNKNKSNIVIESFLSKEYFDINFPVDKRLNIDLQNGDLTLPIVGTETVAITSIIIGGDSNGEIANIEGNNLSSILSNSQSSIFRYEKMSNVLSLSDLFLSITLKTEKQDISNGIYLQLFAENNTQYPNIDTIEVSLDGEVFKKVDYVYEMNKADHFIRFNPEYIRFIKIRLSQSIYSGINTGFGTRYKYSIGIRQLSIKKTVYDPLGAYASIPFTNNKNITSVSFDCVDNGNVKYLISGNNGGKFVEIKNNETMIMYNDKMGVRADSDIQSIRVMVSMDKTNLDMGTINASETAIVNQAGKYFIKHIPKTIEAFIGKNISYGNITKYTVDSRDIKNITNSILETSDGVLSTAILYYIPYTNTLVDDLIFTINGAKIKNDRAIYDIQPDASNENSILQIKNAAMTTDGTLAVYYKSVAASGIKSIQLPRKALITTNDGFIVTETKNGIINQLPNNGYLISDDGIKTTVTIVDNLFASESLYEISYYPAVDISYKLPSNIQSNDITIESIKDIIGLQINFRYTYADNKDKFKLKYYTPICSSYRVKIQ